MAKLVIAEDAPHMLRLLEMTLRKKGHEWTAVRSGDAALEAIRTTKPDAAILDIMMPGMDGLAVLSELKKDADTATTPVIILTALGHSITQQQAFAYGASAFLTKPFSPTELLSILDQIIIKAP
jgi:DNA-binding response OmpR family regulator